MKVRNAIILLTFSVLSALSLSAIAKPLRVEAEVLISNTASTAQSSSENIVAIDEKTGNFLGVFIPKGSGGLNIPDNILFGPDGNLYVSSGGDSGANIYDPSNAPSAILRYNGKTGEPLDAPSAAKAKGSAVFASGGGLIRPYGAAFGPDGNLYVSSFRTNQILRYDGRTGRFIDVFASDNNAGQGSKDGLNGPNGLLFGPDGSLYVATEGTANDSNGNLQFPFDSQVLRYTPEQVAGKKPTTYPIVFVPQPLADPRFGYISFIGLAFGRKDSNIYVSDFANNIRVYTPTGGLVRTLSTYYSGATPNTNTIGYLVFAPNGKDLYTVGTDYTHPSLLPGSLLRFKDAQGGSNTFTGNLFTNTHLARPIGIAFPPDE